MSLLDGGSASTELQELKDKTYSAADLRSEPATLFYNRRIPVAVFTVSASSQMYSPISSDISYRELRSIREEDCDRAVLITAALLDFTPTGNEVLYHDFFIEKDRLSPATLEWLEGYNQMTAFEQDCLSYIPADLLKITNSPYSAVMS